MLLFLFCSYDGNRPGLSEQTQGDRHDDRLAEDRRHVPWRAEVQSEPPAPAVRGHLVSLGWVDHFNDEGPDPNRSLGCHWEGSGLIGNPPQPGRSYVSAKRTRGATVFSLETVLNQAQPLAGPPWGAVPYVVGGVSAQVGVTPVEYLGGQLSVSPISGQGDPAIDGKAINMETGANLTAVAGLQLNFDTRPVPSDRFGLMLMTRTHALPGQTVSPYGADGLNVWLTNSAGRTFMARTYLQKTEFYIDGEWKMVTNHVGDFFWEVWFEVIDVGGGQHRVDTYAGTKKLPGPPPGTLPMNVGGLANNTLYLSQQSGGMNYRCGQVRQCNIGTTQLSDDMVLCSYKHVLPTSPTKGTLFFLVEDVSADLAANVNCTASITKADGATPADWQPLTLTNYGKWGYGVIDNTKDIVMLGGEASFPNGGGRDVRYVIQTQNGFFGAVRGAVMACE